FPGELPVFNIGTNNGKACDATLSERIAAICEASQWPHVVNGRFTGGWINPPHRRPHEGKHAGQKGVAMRGLFQCVSEAPPLGCRFRQAHPADLARCPRSLPWVCSFLKRTTWPLALTTHAQFGHPAVQKSPPAAG